MENEEEKQQFAVDVKDFVQTLIDRQEEFEAKARKRQDEFEAVVLKKLEELDAMFRGPLADALATVGTLVDKRLQKLPPAPGSAAKN